MRDMRDLWARWWWWHKSGWWCWDESVTSTSSDSLRCSASAGLLPPALTATAALQCVLCLQQPMAALRQQSTNTQWAHKHWDSFTIINSILNIKIHFQALDLTRTVCWCFRFWSIVSEFQGRGRHRAAAALLTVCTRSLTPDPRSHSQDTAMMCLEMSEPTLSCQWPSLSRDPGHWFLLDGPTCTLLRDISRNFEW